MTSAAAQPGEPSLPRGAFVALALSVAACGTSTHASSRATPGDASTDASGAMNTGRGGARAGEGGAATGGGGSGGSPGNGGVPGTGGNLASGGAGGNAGSGGLAGTDGATTERCPVDMPAESAPCSGTIGPCRYGMAPRTECRTRADCVSDHWAPTSPPASCTELSAGCPASVPTESSACSIPATTACGYTNASCGCSACCDEPGCAVSCGGLPEASRVWNCEYAPKGVAPCPEIAGNEGAACDLPSGTVCVSNPCGLNVTCQDGIWKWDVKNEPICMAVCASPDTLIATPSGDRAIAELRVGDLVYSVDHDAIWAVPIARAQRVRVERHAVLRIVLDGGVVLEISPRHPMADGRPLAALHRGDLLDGHAVESVELIPYEHDATYDILPASDTGTYFAAGALIGSTMASAHSSERLDHR